MPRATLYFNRSDRRYAHKDLKTVRDINIIYLNETDVENPLIKLSKEVPPLEYNYIYIPDLHRYYYVSEEPKFKDGYYVAQLHVDVLMSFYNYYKTNRVILMRQEKQYNLYQVDEKMKMLNTPCYRVLNFPTDRGFNYSNCQFVMALNGAADS